MKTRGVIKAYGLSQSLLFFLIHGLYAALAQDVLFASILRLGVSQESAYNTAHLNWQGFPGDDAYESPDCR